MKRLLLLLAAMLPAFALQNAQGWCEQGRQTVSTNGVPSSTFVQRSYPSCTVTVYVTGGVTLATIYSDNGVTPLSNPFFAGDSGHWNFYAADGSYTVQLTGSNIGTFTLSPIQLVSSGGGGGGLTPIANNTALGNVSGVTATPGALSKTQLTTLINTFSSTLSGAVPASGGGTTNFMRADGTWAAPAGSGTGTVLSVALAMPSWFVVSGSPVTTTGTLTAAAASGQLSHQVIGTCGAGTSFGPCNLTLGDLPAVGPNVVLGNLGVSAAPSALSQAQLTSLINAFSSTLSGAVPASGGGITTFLRADGTWATPPGSSTGTVTSIGLTMPSWLTVGGSPITTSGTLAVTPTAAQASHQFIATCGAATTFAPCAFTLGDLPTIAGLSVLGNASVGSAVPGALNQTQLTSLISPFNSGTSGATPASGGGTTNFLRADGAWVAPPGGGGGGTGPFYTNITDGAVTQTNATTVTVTNIYGVNNNGVAKSFNTVGTAVAAASSLAAGAQCWIDLEAANFGSEARTINCNTSVTTANLTLTHLTLGATSATGYTAGSIPLGTCTGGVIADQWATCTTIDRTAFNMSRYTTGTGISIGAPDSNGNEAVSTTATLPVAASDLTAQTAALSTQALYTPTATGMVRVSYYAKITTADGTGSVLGGTTGFVLNYTDGTDSVAQTLNVGTFSQAGAVVATGSGNNANTTATANYGTVMVYAKTGVAITYNFGFTRTGSTGQYAIHVKAEVQ